MRAPRGGPQPRAPLRCPPLAASMADTAPPHGAPALPRQIPPEPLLWSPRQSGPGFQDKGPITKPPLATPTQDCPLVTLGTQVPGLCCPHVPSLLGPRHTQKAQSFPALKLSAAPASSAQWLGQHNRPHHPRWVWACTCPPPPLCPWATPEASRSPSPRMPCPAKAPRPGWTDMLPRPISEVVPGECKLAVDPTALGFKGQLAAVQQSRHPQNTGLGAQATWPFLSAASPEQGPASVATALPPWGLLGWVGPG